MVNFQDIVEYLDKETNKIDKLIDKIIKQISNLKKYKQALYIQCCNWEGRCQGGLSG